MTTINITVQSLLNSSSYDLQIVDTAGTNGDLKTAMETNFSYSADWFELVFNDEVLDTAPTIGSYGIVDGSVLRIQNNIANLATKQARQVAKLVLAQLRRQAGGDTSATFYRSHNIYDIDLLADKYTSNTSTVGTTSTLVVGRPWISYVSAGLQVFLQTAPITGTTWTDASGNGNNATIVNTYEGSYAYASDHGGGITLTGAYGAGFNISGYNLPTDGGTYSVEVVASVSSTNYWSSLFGNDDFTLNKGVVAYYGNSSNFYISTPTSNGVYAPVSLATRQNINQYIITVTGNTVKFYLNGVSQALTNNTGGSPGFTASSGTPTNGLMIGARHPNAGTAGVPYDSAGGTYYLVRVYNTLLSQTDVTANYNAIKTTYGI